MAKPLTIQTIFTTLDRLSGPSKTMLGNVNKASKGMAGGFGKVGAGASKMGGLLKGAAVALATGFAAKAVTDFAERGDDIARNASILGLTAKSYQELSFAAKMADIDQEAFTAGTKKLSKNVGDLRMKQGTLYELLAKMNPKLAFQLRDAKSTDDAFMDVAAAISKETNVQKKAQLAMAAFGKTGQDMIPMMEDLAAARAKAQAAGGIMSEKDVHAAERMDDALKRVKIAAGGIINSALGTIAEKLAPLLEKLTVWMTANKDKIGQIIDKIIDIGFRLGKALAPIVKALIPLIEPIMQLIEAIAPIVEGLARLITAILAPIIKWIIPLINKAVTFFGGAQMMPATAGAGGGSPLAPVSSSSSSVSESRLAVDFNNAPPGTSYRQTGAAPGIRLNTGMQMAGGAH